MQLTIHVAVASDDGKFGQNVVGKIMLATGVYGSDAGVAKQDFLQQAESLVRTIAENQIPALYDAVQKQVAAAPDETARLEEKRKLHDKLKSIRDRRTKQKEKQKAVKTDVQQAQDETQPEPQQEDQVQDVVQEETQPREEEQ